MAFYAYYPPNNLTTTTIVGPVTVLQGTTPWIVSGEVLVDQNTFPWVVSGTVAATQSGPWTVTALQGTTPWTVDGTVTALQGTTPWITSGTTTIVGDVTVDQGTSPWVISGTVAATQSGTWSVGRTWTLSNATDSVTAFQGGTWNIGTLTTITNPVTVNQGTSPWIVSGTTTISGPVTVNQGTSPWVDNVAQFGGNNVVTGTGASGLGIPRVTVSNDSNILATQSGTWTVTANQGTSPWVISGTVAATQSGAWTTGRTWTLNNTTDSVTAFQGTSPWIISGSTTVSGSVTVTNFPTTVDTNYGVVGANTIRTASQIGNATGAAAFGAGVTTAQVLRVVLPTDQTAIPVTQSGAWTVTANQGTSPWVVSGTVAATQSGTWNIGTVTSITNPVTVNQGTSPWVISGTTTVSGTVTVSNFPTTVDTNYGVVGANTLRSAAQIGNSTGAADFNTGVTTAQTLRVSANQGTSPWVVSGTVAATQSGTWTTGRTWSLNSGTDSVTVTGTVNQGTNGLPGNAWYMRITDGTSTVGITAFSLNTNVTNGSGASAVNIQDGGNSITVDGTVASSEDKNYGTVGANTLRTAAQIGNSTGAAAFNAGTTTAQTLRVVLPTDQTAIPVSQSGTWTVQPGNTANTTPWLVTDSSDGPVTPGTVAAKSSLAGGQFNTVAPTLTTGQQVALQVDVNGNLKTTATATVAGTVTVVGNVASGATDSGNPVKTGGVYNSTTPTFTNGQRADTQVDTTGSAYVNGEGQKATYSAANSFTAAASPTDVFTITGSATKTIRICNILVTGTNTGNTNVFVRVIKRSTANTGGTSASVANVSHDSTQVAGTATVLAYTANPTLGTSVGAVRSDYVFFPTLASSNPAADLDTRFGIDNSKAVVLRGTSEVLAVNLAGVLIAGTTVVSISITWTEE